jgi:DNA-binding SARP family transcriptional activator/streptogramin lyase
MLPLVGAPPSADRSWPPYTPFVKRVEVNLLGPLELRLDGRPISLTASKQRALIAALALRVGETVGREQLIDALWGEQPPTTVDTGLNVLVARVRRALGGGASVLQRDAAGYRLAAEADAVDGRRFERLHEEGRRALADGNAKEARRLLREALALWRGPALGEFALEEFAASETRRLEAVRLVALEDRIDADLASGQDAGLVGELEALVATHPLRERLQGQLMLALYRSGRQAEALERYRQLYRILRDELGVEPGPDLQRLHEAMLRHAPEVVPERPLELAVTPRSRAGTRRGVLIAAVAASFVVVGAVLLAITRPWSRANSSAPLVSVPKGVLVALDPQSGLRLSTVSIGNAPSAVAVGPSGVWVVDAHDRTLSRIDPVRRTLTDTLGVGGATTDVVVGGGDVWVSTTEPQRLVRIDSRLSSVESQIPIGVGGGGRARLALGGGSIWVARNLASLERVSLRSGRVVRRFRVRAGGGGIAVGLGAVWVPTFFPRGVARVPVAGGGPRRLPTRHVVVDVAVAGGSVWLAIPEEDRVARLDPERMAISASVDAGDAPSALVADGRGLWAASRVSKTLSRIDPRSGRVVRTVRLTASPSALALGAGALWVVTGPG